MALPGDTSSFVSHNKVLIQTNPSKGYTQYPAWVNFPQASKSYNKVLLYFSVKCPNSLHCGEWDYLNYIRIKRAGGVNSPVLNYEIARFITPYGWGFDGNWNFKWVADVTDFSLLLHDSVEIEYTHTGYEASADRGWLITLDFKVIEGTPVLPPIAIQPLWKGSINYGGTKTFDELIQEDTVTLNVNTRNARFRIVQSGHGKDNPDGCGEFCSKLRTVKWDGVVTDTRSVWRNNCGLNPVFPQNGTWLIDRAGWCPGDFVYPDIYNFSVNGSSTHRIDVDMEPYLSQGGANYVIESFLIETGAPSFTLDAAVDQIITPNIEPYYLRQNGICNNPQIIIRNTGSTTLTSLVIQYQIEGQPVSTYNWTGSLKFDETEKVTLGHLDWLGATSGNSRFKVTVSNPNGGTDQYAYNNVAYSYVKQTPKLDNQLVVWVMTNKDSTENAYTITDDNGIVYKSKSFSKPSFVHKDTVLLPLNGCFKFKLTDAGKDGLSFWANSSGSGYARIRNMAGSNLITFNGDFGTEIEYNFTTGFRLSTPQKYLPSDIIVFPNPARELLNIDLPEVNYSTVKVQISDLQGRILIHTDWQNPGAMISQDVADLPSGIYLLHLMAENLLLTKKVLIQK